jgi:hypothetical protein
MLRRLTLPVLTVLLIISAVLPAYAAPRRSRIRHISRVSVQAEGRGSVIAVTYAAGPRKHVRFLHSSIAVDRVALSVNKDGEQDIVAALPDGDLQLWRNTGYGRFSVATIAHAVRPVSERGPRIVRYQDADDGWQWSEERYDAAMPRAPAIAAVDAVSVLRLPATVLAPLVAIRSSSGRAPPSI